VKVDLNYSEQVIAARNYRVHLRSGFLMSETLLIMQQLGCCEAKACQFVFTLLSHIAVTLLLDFMIGACCLPQQHHDSNQRPLLASATSVQLICLTMYISFTVRSQLVISADTSAEEVVLKFLVPSLGHMC
jgi:hypothetical protein